VAAAIYDFVSAELETQTQLGRLEARGTLRLALKEAGLDAGTVTGTQMVVVLAKLMPGEMRARGVASADDVCRSIAAALEERFLDEATAAAESPEAIFRRLAES
jgi:hypothetical protein